MVTLMYTRDTRGRPKRITDRVYLREEKSSVQSVIPVTIGAVCCRKTFFVIYFSEINTRNGVRAHPTGWCARARERFNRCVGWPSTLVFVRTTRRLRGTGRNNKPGIRGYITRRAKKKNILPISYEKRVRFHSYRTIINTQTRNSGKQK